jgi:hypothetical protein
MRLNRAQSVVEYGIAVAAIIIALVVMQVYVKRGLQGRYKDLVDAASKEIAPAGQRQYEPYYGDISAEAKVNITKRERIYPDDKRHNTFSQEYNYTQKRSDSFESD